ncbi:unnamed protein product [Hydatigera taeniaeformis]|uniref:RUN domain-containing protein n=1 Tax=Hydatigena taeniaeformis TaxID=6205 RepID=A0A0R3WIU6_HYDTA|nr:unnamed protein product [Hydatigera taeniaeformis]
MSESVLLHKPLSRVLDALLPSPLDADDDIFCRLKVRDILQNVTSAHSDPKSLCYKFRDVCFDNKLAESDQIDAQDSNPLDCVDSPNPDLDTGVYDPAKDEVEKKAFNRFIDRNDMSSIKFRDITYNCSKIPVNKSISAEFEEKYYFCTNTEESEENGSADRSTNLHQKMNDSNYNASVEEGGLKEVGMCLVQENTDSLPPSSEVNLHKAGGNVRTKLRLAAKLMGMRARQCKVAKKCPPITFALAKEVERLTARSRHRRQVHEKSQHSEWLQETEVYEKLVSTLEQYQQLQAHTTKKTLLEGRMQSSVLFNDLQNCFRNACCFMEGTIKGLRRFAPTSDIVRHWWIKASLLLQNSLRLKIGTVTRSSISRVPLREEVFWLFSRLYFDSNCSERLTEYGSIDSYLQMDQMIEMAKSSLQLRGKQRSTVPSEPPKLVKVDTNDSGSREGTISTTELFSHLSDLSYLEELKAKYANMLTQKESEAHSPGVFQTEVCPQGEKVGQLKGEKNLRSSLDEQKTAKSSNPSTVSNVLLRLSERSGITSKSEKSEQRENTVGILDCEKDRDAFHERLDHLRHIYPHPYSVKYVKNLAIDEDFKLLLPTEQLLKNIIRQLPLENMEDKADDNGDTNAEMVRRTMRLSFSRLPFLLKTILRKNAVVLEPNQEIIPRILGINDQRSDSYNLSDMDAVIYRQQEPLQGLREGSEKYLLKCLSPEFIFSGSKKNASENRDGGYGTLTVLMLPPESTEAHDILDLAGRLMDEYVPHIKEVFQSVFEAVRADFEWVVERDEEILGVGLTHLARDLLRYRNTPGHCVRFKILSVIAAASKNSKLLNQLQMTAKMPNGWMDQTLRTFNSAYSSCRIEAAFIVAFMAKRRKLVQRFRLSSNFETLLYDIATSLLRAADLFEEDFCEIFLALSYLFHFIQHRALVEALIDRYSAFCSVQLTSAWPLLIVYAFRFWSTTTINDMTVRGKRVIAALHRALCNPLSRRNARMAVDAVERATTLQTDILTRWPTISEAPEETTS